MNSHINLLMDVNRDSGTASDNGGSGDLSGRWEIIWMLPNIICQK
jgi:hypothetical protein